MAFGKVWKGSVLAQITPSHVGLLRVKLSDYPALLEDFGSVRIGINPIDNPDGPLGFFYPILINHETGGTYYALDTACRHAGCVVPPYDPFSDAIICPCHGSGYAIDGSVLNGPTVSPLFRYPITFDGVDTLTVELPGLGYRVDSSLVQSADVPMLRLDFPTFENVEYEVKFRERMGDDWTITPFGLSPDNPPDMLSMIADGSPATVFVNRTSPTGFYTAAIKLIDLTEG